MADILTNKQQAVYDFVRKEIKRNGYAPTVREIGDGIGISSTSTVHAHLESLQRKGYIKRFPSKNRMIEILEDGFNIALEYTPVPIVSKIAKKSPIVQEENTTGLYLVPNSYLDGSDFFMYSLEADSDDESIKAGDLLLVKPGKRVKIGELVLVHDSGSAVVKRIQDKKASKKELIGKVVALYRRY